MSNPYKQNEALLATEGSVEITQSTLLCYNGIYFRIVDVQPVVFSETKEIKVDARYEGFRTQAVMRKPND